jgi:hypothetical protein
VQKCSIEAIAKRQIDQARNSAAARAATTVYGGHEHALRQTAVGLRHTLTAEEDSAVLLTAVPGNRAGLRYMCVPVTCLPISR